MQKVQGYDNCVTFACQQRDGFWVRRKSRITKSFLHGNGRTAVHIEQSNVPILCKNIPLFVKDGELERFLDMERPASSCLQSAWTGNTWRTLAGVVKFAETKCSLSIHLFWPTNRQCVRLPK